MSRLLYLSGEDVIKLGGLDMKTALAETEEALKLVYQNKCIVPGKISMGFGNSIAEESTKGRINAMPSYLGGRFDIAGIKWIGSNPKNIEKGLPRASAVIVLNDPDTKMPVCFMNGADISAVRTGASSGVAAKYLAKENAETILLIGAGYQNQMQLEAIYLIRPSLKYFYVVDIAAAHPGNLHICVGGLDHPALYKRADKIVCDSWTQVRHRPVCYMAQDALAGRFDESKIYAEEIGEIIAGDKKGRENDKEFCYYKPVGIGVLDLAIASRLYSKAKQLGLGVNLEF